MLAPWTWFIGLFSLLISHQSAAYTRPSDTTALKSLLNGWRSTLNTNWSGNDPCGLFWKGISCENGTVTALMLNNMDISGNLSSAIGDLTNLTVLSLQKNHLQGRIPPEIGNLSSLVTLRLTSNNFIGAIPYSINKLLKLEEMSLSFNALQGDLPNISSLRSLRIVNLESNELHGRLPSEVVTFKALRMLKLSNNQFSGELPQNISSLSELTTLYLDHNLLNGSLPDLSGLNNLQYLWLASNHLTGPIPPEIGSLASLQNLGLEKNHFTGTIPASLGQLSNIPYLFLHNNNLTGTVPDLSGLISLNGLSLQNNSIVLEVLPTWISSIQNLQLLYLGKCSLGGAFPFEIINKLYALTSVGFNDNSFNGTLDVNSINKNITSFAIENNRITQLNGQVRSNLDLKLGGNPICDNVTFSLPDLCELSDGTGLRTWKQQVVCSEQTCPKMQKLIPSTCNCTYPLSCELLLVSPTFKSITGARMGAVERDIASLLKIDSHTVWIENATFTSKNQTQILVLFFPSASGRWKRKEMNSIASNLQSSKSLSTYGPFQILTLTMPEGNIIAKKSYLVMYLSISLSAFAAIFAAVISVLLWRRHQYQKLSIMYGVQKEFAKHSLQPTFFSYRIIKLATGDFNPKNKLGGGAFGEVYKGVLFEDTIAVKRLYPSRLQQEIEEFVNEVTILTKVVHRNLVKILGCCVEDNERILVYEFAENNSLYHALFGPEPIMLDWNCRVNIALGTARGSAYLHEDCLPRIIHRDIKAANILLDKKMQPKIADFGLARLVPEGATHVSTGVAGTFGYFAPEYGLYGQLTEKADVYSYGVVVLEIITGRKCVNLTETDSVLLEWAWECHETGRDLELVDARLKNDFDEESVRRLLHVAFLCTQEDPQSRPCMSSVVSMVLGEKDLKDLTPCPSRLSIKSQFINRNHPIKSSSTSTMATDSTSTSTIGSTSQPFFHGNLKLLS